MKIPEMIETLQPTRNEFLVRFYRWAKEDSIREFREGFPFVRAIRNPVSSRFHRFVGGLSGAEGAILSSALVKKAHQRAVDLLEDFLTADERAMLDRYRAYDHASGEVLSRNPAPLRKAPLRRLLRRTLSSIMADSSQISNGDVWTFRKQSGCWTVRTEIDTGGRRLLQFSHSINAHEAVPLHANTSVLSWLGISQSYWADGDNCDPEQISSSVVRAYLHFTAAAADLLQGLSHKLPEPEVRSWRNAATVTGHRKNGMSIIVLDSAEFRNTIRGKAKWDIPTSIIPVQLRAIGSHFTIVQDSDFTRQSGDAIAMSSTYKHVKVEP